ncbi:MAG: exosortase/archaeosortase family protein [Vicinamibacterales bacterium]
MALTAEYAPPKPAPAAPATSVRSVWGTVLLAVVAIELIALYAPTARWLYGRWTMSVWHNAHGLFIPPLVGWMVWQELKARPDLPTSSSPWGFAFLVPALALQVIDTGMHTDLLSAIGLVLALPGLALLFLGAARTRLIAFPLFLATFALPIPLGLTETIHLVLRKIAITGASAVLPLFGVTIFSEGTTMHTVRGSLEVADACSGFSTLYAAMAVAFLTAYTAATNTRRALVLLLAAPIAIASNVLRVVILVGLVVWQGQPILETFLHPLSGMMTFALSLPIIFWLGGPPAARTPAP